MSQTATEAPAWQQQIADQVAELGIPDDASHVVVHLKEEGDATLLAIVESEAAGVVQAEDLATKVDGGEVTVVRLEQIKPLIGGLDADLELEPDAEVDETPPDTPPAPEATGEDADKGQLFDLPRIKVIIDDSDPTVLKLAFGGSIELERGTNTDVELYNKLKAGKNATLTVGVFVAGPKTTHRRDSEGDVDAVVQTKSIIVHSIDDVV